MQKQFSVSIIGCGSRGCDVYGRLFSQQPERFHIAALCDIRPERLERFGKLYNTRQLFTDEEEFFRERRSDALVIATQDRDHVRMCLRALQLGYTVLLEKPVTPDKAQLKELLAAAERSAGKVLVCHVLRYAPAFVRAKRILESGAIGDLVLIDALEQVAYWHQAHSFVRGNWRNEEETSPMLLAKCCHDLDLLQYYAGSAADKVYSTGGLTFFHRGNHPADAAERCAECRYLHTCAYSAERLYIERWKAQGMPKDGWPYNVIALAPNTEESLRAAYENGPYGRCVFCCDNDVVDHQTVSVSFANGVKAQLTMTAFTERGGRRYTFHGTLGELQLDETRDLLLLAPFGGTQERWRISDLVAAARSQGHGGGDTETVAAFYDLLCGKEREETMLERSAESHFIAYAAERSRRAGIAVDMANER